MAASAFQQNLFFRGGRQSEVAGVEMSDGYPALLVWLIYVTVVMTIAVVQTGFERGRQFNLRNLFFFASLLAILLGLLVMLWRR